MPTWRESQQTSPAAPTEFHPTEIALRDVFREQGDALHDVVGLSQEQRTARETDYAGVVRDSGLEPYTLGVEIYEAWTRAEVEDVRGGDDVDVQALNEASRKVLRETYGPDTEDLLGRAANSFVRSRSLQRSSNSAASGRSRRSSRRSSSTCAESITARSDAPCRSVPRYGERQAQPTPLSGGRLTAAETPLSQGAGVERARADKSRAIGGFGERVAQHSLGVYERVRQRQDEVRVTAAENELATWELERLDDPDEGALHTVRGRASLELPSTLGAEFDKRALDIEAGCSRARSATPSPVSRTAGASSCSAESPPTRVGSCVPMNRRKSRPRSTTPCSAPAPRSPRCRRRRS